LLAALGQLFEFAAEIHVALRPFEALAADEAADLNLDELSG
jgi:hypothetical protein